MKSLTGDWHIDIDFVCGSTRHTAHLEQEGEELKGRYRSPFAEYEVRGRAGGDGAVELHVSVGFQHVGAHYAFRGRVAGDRLAGQLDLGEYWSAAWKATRAG